MMNWQTIRILAVGLVALETAGCVSTETADGDRAAWAAVPATDPLIAITDGLNPSTVADGSVRFDRVIDTPGRGFRWDSPGARMRWRTNSSETRARLRYSAGHTGSSRNSIGVLRVDGRTDPAWTFTRPGPGVAEVTVPMPVPADGGWHDYEVILPYGDSLDLVGVDIRADAKLEAPAPRPAVRYLAFGDSITHGFTASVVTKTYAFGVAERNGWELVNLGIGSRGTYGPDGAMLAGIEADVVSILIGVNDWQAGADLESFRRNYTAIITGLSTAQPERPVYFITPLWVPPTWKPTAARYPLEAYRRVIREVVGANGDPRLRLVEGPDLIEHDPALFDPIAVHPNDGGFAQMARRLAEAMQ